MIVINFTGTPLYWRRIVSNKEYFAKQNKRQRGRNPEAQKSGTVCIFTIYSGFPVEWHQILPICTEFFLPRLKTFYILTFLVKLQIWKPDWIILLLSCLPCKLSSEMCNSMGCCDQVYTDHYDYTELFIWLEVENTGIHFYIKFIVSCKILF